jgi:hypothetical protein
MGGYRLFVIPEDVRTHHRRQPPMMPGPWFPGWVRAGSYHVRDSQQVRQISPDKNVNCRYTTAAFTLSPEFGASSCVADLPGDWALYAVSVRRLIALHSGFLQTVPRGNASRSKSGIFDLPSASDVTNKYRYTFFHLYERGFSFRYSMPRWRPCSISSGVL